ncbi:alpha-keto acid decarboxylase family protein [Pseudonocardia oroxyli]|uniref:Alpha-keto-acid decarboxylase n=1 Tax=Pseudonocardia oroxyli TaxID=366584 RepID=A0A1G7JEF3_PSEOR|nr:thiamine pyrophosphate-binding protein [Pseudonocardia oroxyli]SDF23322.1 indolepyruvate decarboxylase [Pseudonocardia oroxyli]
MNTTRNKRLLDGMETVAQYLARKLHALGARHLFGVPGDFSLSLLDSVLETGLLEWVGSPNELNAGYAADAYARTRGIGALVTTFGVGELSALNAVAGAYAENVPLVQITGAPATTRDGMLLHHTLGDGDFTHFARAYAEVTAAGAILTHDDPCARIDEVLQTAVDEQRPVYLVVPADVALTEAQCGATTVVSDAENDSRGSTLRFSAAVRALLGSAQSAAVIAGHLVERTRSQGVFGALVSALDSPVVTLSSGRGAIDSTHPRFAGVYIGGIGAKRAQLAVETADVLIEVGTLMADAVTGMFSHRDDPAHTIHLGVRTARVAGREYAVPFADALRILTELATPLPRELPDVPAAGPVVGETLDQDTLWATLERLLPAGSRLVTDIGTTFWGAAGITLPAGVDVVAQPVWSSIGYALPATLGCALAAPERRPVLVIGDGAAQMTVQELGTLARHANPVIVVVDNSGYTIERALQSPQAVYNDVAAWDWTALARAFAPGIDLRTAAPSTPDELATELSAALADDRMAVLHVRLDALDVPAGLRALADRHRR